MEADIRMHVAFLLTELVSERSSADRSQERLLKLLWLAGTYSDETGNRAYINAIKLMTRNKIVNEDEIDNIVSGVNAEMEREKLLSRISP